MPENRPLIEARSLYKVFAPRKVTALSGVSLDLFENECVGLVGGSGSGKSTLGKILCGLLKADKGTCLIEGTPVGKMSRVERARKIQMIFQNPYECLTPTMTVGALLEEALAITLPTSLPPTPHSLLSDVGLPSEAASWYPHQCSGGQRQRIGIARALALNPKILVADEPLSALDVLTQSQILRLLISLKEKYKMAILFITHDTHLVRRIAGRVIVLENGNVVEQGSTAAVFSAPQHVYTRQLIEAELPL